MQSSCTCVCAAFRISFSFQLAKLHVPFLILVIKCPQYYPSFSEKISSVTTKEKELIKNVLHIAEENGEIKSNMNLIFVSDMFYNSYSGLLLYSSLPTSENFGDKLLVTFENVYSLIKADN